MMAKHPVKGRRRRPMGKYMKGAVEETLTLGTLAARTLISDIFDNVTEEKAFVSSLVATWTLDEFTNAIGDGPIAVGVAHSDYTDAEIETVIKNTGSWKQGDLIQQEISVRKVRIIGTFRTSQADSQGIAVLNDGKPIKTKLNWLLMSGQSLRLWAYNMGDNALATTVPNVQIIGHANLWGR